MSRRQKDPLRARSQEEQRELEHLSRSQSEPAGVVAHAKALLAVAAGQSYTAAAQAAGRRSGDGVAQLGARFNREGVAGVYARPAGGPAPRYPAVERERILAEVQRPPQRRQDGTATGSLTTLQRALRTAPDGWAPVSTYPIWGVLREAGWSWQRSRSWCPTGTTWRKRKRGVVRVHDPDATPPQK